MNYKSLRTPKPGPFGGSINEDNPPNGSAANLPDLGPALVFLPCFKSLIISLTSFSVKSSYYVSNSI